MNRRCALVLGALASLFLAACVRLGWERAWTNTPLPEEIVQELVPGQADLTACLETLGAPLYVWELNSSSYAIAYGWNDGRTWGVNVSASTGQGPSAVVDFDSLSLDLHGVVLAFDRGDRLLWRREGHLRDIAFGLERSRPLVPVGEDPDAPDS